jgi:selenide,water dikinase
MRGAAEKVREAGAVIAGGHTIRDQEPKVGLVVVGLSRPDGFLTKADAQPGDVLILSKPLGTGSITTAAKNDKAQAEHLEEAVRWMSRLNRAAADAATAAGAHAATDVTGFGLMGHGTEMADMSDVTLEIHFDAVPLLPGVRQYAKDWIFPGGSIDNMRTYEGGVRFAEGFKDEEKVILFDAQTSGGLLISLPPENLLAFKAAMEAADAPFWEIGVVRPREDMSIAIIR